MNQSEFLAATLRNPVNVAIADELFRLALPDAWLVSGCLVQTVWNVLTNRAPDYGVADYDIFYFDPDTSWAAEDVVIREMQDVFSGLGVKIEARNQARVHLWYPEKHGLPYPALRSSREGIDRFLTKNTRVGIRRTQVGYDVYAPDGFDDIAGLIVRPNPGPNFSADNYLAKAARWKVLWPEITVLAVDQIRRRPGQASNASADPGPTPRRVLLRTLLDGFRSTTQAGGYGSRIGAPCGRLSGTTMDRATLPRPK